MAIEEIIDRDHACPVYGIGIGIGIGIEVEIGMGIVPADCFGRVMCHTCVMCCAIKLIVTSLLDD